MATLTALVSNSGYKIKNINIHKFIYIYIYIYTHRTLPGAQELCQ
jgi:hypothetical protein